MNTSKEKHGKIRMAFTCFINILEFEGTKPLPTKLAKSKFYNFIFIPSLHHIYNHRLVKAGPQFETDYTGDSVETDG